MSDPARSGALPEDLRELGDLRAEYAPSRMHNFLGCLMVGACLLLGGALTLPPLILLVLGKVVPESAIVLGVGLAALGFGVYLWRKKRREARSRVFVFSEGLVHIQGDELDTYRWDDIEACWEAVAQVTIHGIPAGTNHTYTLRRRDGRKAVFHDAFKNVEQLGQTIRTETVARQLPRALESLQAGAPVAFGNLTVETDGLRSGKDLLPWELVRSVELADGWITIRKEGKWFRWDSVAVAQVPNAYVFFTLAQGLMVRKG